jgi:Tfp pilus assembly protein FimT
LLKIYYSQGITFAELLIALVIVSVLILVGVPAFISFYQEYRLSTNTEKLYYALQL